ncbi:hypothetical protein D1BOALGB6SA_3195 [Olavius sp. associated proteobacterium Delta 1]|nr:hypothetical protein D1BOALGB6SA_3195 [Olavius sp. associated proteobacterium Delta 1]
MASKLQIDSFYADLLPENKVSIFEELSRQNSLVILLYGD